MNFDLTEFKGSTLGPDTDYRRSSISFNAFFHGGKKRNYRSKHVLYHVQAFEELKQLAANGAPISKSKLDAVIHAGVTECESIWDFYAKIGYQHRSNKFTKSEKLAHLIKLRGDIGVMFDQLAKLRASMQTDKETYREELKMLDEINLWSVWFKLKRKELD